MYFDRWHADVAAGKPTLGMLAGLYDVSTRWIVTRDIAHWKEEIAWMSLYFSAAIWSSLALCAVALVKDRLAYYRTRPKVRQRLDLRVPVRISTGRPF